MSISKTLSRYFSVMPIKYKLMVLMMLLSVLSIGFTTIAYISAGVMYIRQNQANELKVLAEILGDKNAAALAFGNKDLVKANVAMLAARGDILGACIYDTDGQVYARYGSGFRCLKPEPDKVQWAKRHLDVFYTITKKGHMLGTLFIRSDLKAVEVYIHTQVTTALVIILVALMISYLLALKLQKMISNPIVALAKDSMAVLEGNNLSGRTRKIYYDELGQIADSFNRVLEERENKHKEFFSRHQELAEVFKNSERTLATLDDEAIFPFKAATTFKQLLDMQAFGPVHDRYKDYFNDVYSAEIELYHVLVTALDTFKLHAEMFEQGREEIRVHEVLSQVFGKELSGKMNSRIEYCLDITEDLPYACYRKPFRQMLEILASLFLESRKMGCFYTLACDVDGDDDTPRVTVTFQDKATLGHISNDNFRELTLGEVIKSLKCKEHIIQESCIDLQSPSIRNALYSIAFLGDINKCDISLRFFPGKVSFIFTLPTPYLKAIVNVS